MDQTQYCDYDYTSVMDQTQYCDYDYTSVMDQTQYTANMLIVLSPVGESKDNGFWH